MKVRIAITVEIDPDAWANVYGIDRGDVRKDVQQWAQATITNQLLETGAST